MVTGRYNTTHIRLYINGTAVATTAIASVNNPSTSWLIGGRGFSGLNCNCSIDMYAVWNRSLTDSEITQLWNSGSGLTYPFSGGTTTPPTFIFPTPANNAHNNTQVTINMSCPNANRFYLWFDNNTSPTTLVLNNASTGNYTTNVNISQNYYYMGGCFNSTTGFSSNTTVYNWVYDVTFPTITINTGNAFKLNNITQISPYGNMSLNMTFTDNSALYGYLINVTRSGIVYYNETNLSLSGINYNYTKTLNTASWTNGVYNIKVLVADSHTAKSIPDYQVTKKKSSITFKPGNDNNIKIETRETSTIDTDKEFDRYVFKISFDDGLTKTRVFDVKTDKCPLTYLPNSPYKAHFVSTCSLTEGGNWIDFEGLSTNYTVIKSDDYHYIVTFQNVPPYVEFRSIGGLNEYEADFSWYKGSYTLTALASGINEPGNISLNISKDTITHQSYRASMNYNNTIYNPTYQNNQSTYTLFFQNFTSYNVGNTYIYNFTVNLTLTDNSSILLYFSGTHLVFDYGLYNCSETNVNKTITYYFYEEDNPSTRLNTTMKLDSTIWISNPAINKNYSHLYTGGNNYTLCFYPTDQTIYANIYNQNYAAANLTHRHYLFNHIINNQTPQNISLYNFPTTERLSDLRLVVRNTQYQYMSEVLVKLQRFYVDEGVWRVVQEDLSGDYGLTFFDIYEISQDYKVSFYDTSGNLYKTTDTLKFSCSAGICDVTSLLDESAITIPATKIEVTTSFDNSTKLLTISWSDASLGDNDIQIFVTKETMTGTTNICNVYQTGSAGMTSCNLTGYNGDVFVQVSEAHSPYTPIFSEIISLARQQIANLLGGNDSALWTFGIMVTVIGFGVFSPVGAVMATVTGLFMVMLLGFFNPMTMTFLVVAGAMGIAIGIKLRQ